jgi:glyoxylase-like metal-dependent hydrolase (beta-lactamase superfamily II)
MLDRRQLLTGMAAAMAGGLLAPRAARAQNSGIRPLSGRVSLVTAGRTNVVALSTADSLVLVDSGVPEMAEALTTALQPLAGRGLTLFNTHYHAEHTGGNEALRQAGASIVAHENTRLWMATPTWMPADDRYRPPRPTGSQPTRTFYKDGSMQAAGERIEYGYLLEAHTSGDIYVFFRGSNVLAVGDVASPARDPQLDYLTGAWIGGRADALARLVELADSATTIVPGVGPVMTRAQLAAERDLMKTIYDRTVDRVREGDSAADMLTAGVLNGLSRGFTDPGRFLYDLQKGLWAHHNKLSPNVV